MRRVALLSTLASLTACGAAEPRATLAAPSSPRITATVSEAVGCRIEHEGPSDAPLRVRSLETGVAFDAEGTRALLLLSGDHGHVAIEAAPWVVEGVVRGDELPLWTTRPLLLAGAFIPNRVRWSDARDGVVRVDADLPEGVSLVRPLARLVPCEMVALRGYEHDMLEELVGPLALGAGVVVRAPLGLVSLRDAEGEVVATLRGTEWNGWELGRHEGRVQVLLRTGEDLVWGEVEQTFAESITLDHGSLDLEGLGVGQSVVSPVVRCEHDVPLFVGSEHAPIGRLRAGVGLPEWNTESEWIDVEPSGLSALEGSFSVRFDDVSECSF
ncbi:MAG: hypothetical protein H6722_11780 [Sandaracinus sp.]|nr:hypothetical protein [Sandaracinus sp.]MCB9613124.1 hypothetical protein [Sandaracinus sp.]